MPEHKTGTREEWQAPREALLEAENEHARRSEELAKQRQELPWVPVEREYTFDTDEGKKTLAELFDDFGLALTAEQLAGIDEVQEMIAAPSDWLAEWAVQVGTDLEHGLAEGPGWIAFALEDGVVYHTYTRMAPDRDFVAPYYHLLLDRTPKGRSDDSRAWRHDEY